MVVHFLKPLLFSLGLFCVCTPWRQVQKLCDFIHKIRGISFSCLPWDFPRTPWIPGFSFPCTSDQKDLNIFFRLLAFSTVRKFLVTGASHFADNYLNSHFSPQSTSYFFFSFQSPQVVHFAFCSESLVVNQ